MGSIDVSVRLPHTNQGQNLIQRFLRVNVKTLFLVRVMMSLQLQYKCKVREANLIIDCSWLFSFPNSNAGVDFSPNA